MKKIIQKRIVTRKGSAMVYMLVMIVIATITMTSLLGYITSQINYSGDRVERERAFQIAEAGIYFYRWYLAHEISGKTAQQINDFWQSGNPLGGGELGDDIDYKDPEGAVIGKYNLKVIRPSFGSTIVTVKSVGSTIKNPNIKRTIQVRFRRPSWSENVVLANDNMRFGAGTTVTGKIHSNMGVRFDGVATNIVSSSLASYDDPDHTGNVEFGVHTHINAPPGSGQNDNFRPAEAPPSLVPARTDVFQAGRVFPVAQIDFASVVSDIAFMRSQAGVKYDNTGAGRYIKFYNDGTMDMCKVATFDSVSNNITNYAGVVSGATGGSSGTNGSACIATTCCASANCPLIQSGKAARGKCVSLTNSVVPANGIIFAANNLWLEGIINNEKVTVVAAELSDEPGYTGGQKNVYLGMDDLLYTNFDGRDILGIIAQKDVEIIRDSKTVLTIDAALLAKEGRVGRQNYGNTKNSITVNGSIATYSRYGFAYTDGTGYQIRNLNFDNNLLYFPPPLFPTGTEYSIDQWDEL